MRGLRIFSTDFVLISISEVFQMFFSAAFIVTDLSLILRSRFLASAELCIDNSLVFDTLAARDDEDDTFTDMMMIYRNLL